MKHNSSRILAFYIKMFQFAKWRETRREWEGGEGEGGRDKHWLCMDGHADYVVREIPATAATIIIIYDFLFLLFSIGDL